MSATWTTLVGKYDWDASPQRGAPCRSPDERAIGNGPDKNPKSKPKGNRPRFLSLPTHMPHTHQGPVLVLSRAVDDDGAELAVPACLRPIHAIIFVIGADQAPRRVRLR